VLEKKQTALSAAVFQFKLGTQEATLPIFAGEIPTAQLRSDVPGLESSTDFPCGCRRFDIRLRIAPRCFLGRRP
jgi:hypothetical protein